MINTITLKDTAMWYRFNEDMQSTKGKHKDQKSSSRTLGEK